MYGIQLRQKLKEMYSTNCLYYKRGTFSNWLSKSFKKLIKTEQAKPKPRQCQEIIKSRNQWNLNLKSNRRGLFIYLFIFWGYLLDSIILTYFEEFKAIILRVARGSYKPDPPQGSQPGKKMEVTVWVWHCPLLAGHAGQLQRLLWSWMDTCIKHTHTGKQRLYTSPLKFTKDTPKPWKICF